jgi:hypothetical protein
VPHWERTRPDTQPAACLLAKPTQLNINLSSDRFAMFNKERDISDAEDQSIKFGVGLLIGVRKTSQHTVVERAFLQDWPVRT